MSEVKHMSDGPMNGAQAVMAQQAALAEARAHIVELETLLERALDPNDYGIIKGLRRMLYAHRDELGAIHHRHRTEVQALKGERDAEVARLREQHRGIVENLNADQADMLDRMQMKVREPYVSPRPEAGT